MYRIYFKNRYITVALIDELPKNDSNSIIYYSADSSVLHNLPLLFENSHAMENIYIVSDNIDETFGTLAAKLTHISAGGGLVENQNGEFLMIYRQGMWDLPKGKQETGEDIKTSALREVTEECGVNSLEIDSFIGTTFHTYMLEGTFMLKETKWYHMKYKGDGKTTPQLAENIEKAVWIKPEELSEYVNETYPSVQDVFLEFLSKKSDKILSYLKSLI